MDGFNHIRIKTVHVYIFSDLLHVIFFTNRHPIRLHLLPPKVKEGVRKDVEDLIYVIPI